jgi:hypothetical protein
VVSESEPSFEELLDACRLSAVHLEMRDVYMTNDPVYRDWVAGHPVNAAQSYAEWFALVQRVAARGVEFRRLRVVAEPASSYIRFEHAITDELNIDAGERVRWLLRRDALGILLPANDIWILDGRIVRFGFFTPDGDELGSVTIDDPQTVSECTAAFERAWDHGTDHKDFQLS